MSRRRSVSVFANNEPVSIWFGSIPFWEVYKRIVYREGFVRVQVLIKLLPCSFFHHIS